MKKTIKIEKHENKTSKNGKDYTRFQTSDGWMSCFESDVIEDLMAAEGYNCSVEVVTKGDFTNLRGFYGVVPDQLQNMRDESQKPEVKTEKIPKAEPNRNASFWTSYAKDIFVSFVNSGVDGQHDNLMNKAIDLVKRAKEEFE